MHFQKRGQNLHQSKRKNKRTRTTHTHATIILIKRAFREQREGGEGERGRSRQDLLEKKRVFHPYDVKGKANGNFLVFFLERNFKINLQFGTENICIR